MKAVQEGYRHSHNYNLNTDNSEKNTRRVIVLTLIMMTAEISGGLMFGSMSLLADGWHMGTHAAALGITAFAYYYARKHATSERFSFGTGKVGVLGGFASAIGLLCVSALMIIESIHRFINPIDIHYKEAILVAVVGLVVNVASAFLLHGGGGHHHHGSDHACTGHHDHHHDHNLKAAYLHVLADALTSVLAIIALIVGNYLGWAFLDPAIGVIGGVVIAKWSYGLIKDTSSILLDSNAQRELCDNVVKIIEADSDDRVTDLHIWNISDHSMAVILSILTPTSKTSDEYKKQLEKYHHFKHITVEVNPI